MPAEYPREATRPSPYNPHYSGFGLLFQLNSADEALPVPSDAFWMRGSGGHAISVVPSLNWVVWKMGGRNDQFDERNNGLPELHPFTATRPPWKPAVDEAVAAKRTLEMVVAAIHDVP